jgi:hypothetical protein
MNAEKKPKDSTVEDPEFSPESVVISKTVSVNSTEKTLDSKRTLAPGSHLPASENASSASKSSGASNRTAESPTEEDLT